MSQVYNQQEVTSPTGSIKRTMLLSMGASDADSGCALEEFSWVPPGLAPQQVGICGILSLRVIDKSPHVVDISHHFM